MHSLDTVKRLYVLFWKANYTESHKSTLANLLPNADKLNSNMFCIKKFRITPNVTQFYI
jgi:hypothetical protein